MDPTAPTASASAVTPTGCCPPFDAATYQDKEVVWQHKTFFHDHLRTFFHVPLGMGRHMVRDKALIDAAGAAPAQPLMLADDASPWSMDLLIDVTRPVPGATMEAVSGRFLTRVFEGPYRDAPRWAEEMERFVAAKGERLEKLYFGYVMCPACARAYGKNQVVLFARVADRPSAAA